MLGPCGEGGEVGMWLLQHMGTQCQPEPCAKSDVAGLVGDKALISMGINLPIIMSAAVLTYCTKAVEMCPVALCLENAFDFLP